MTYGTFDIIGRAERVFGYIVADLKYNQFLEKAGSSVTILPTRQALNFLLWEAVKMQLKLRNLDG